MPDLDLSCWAADRGASIFGAMSDISREIEEIRREYGPRLYILGHHYQRASVLRHADDIGDSLELARKAAARREAERIVFCGVRFMAESADILTASDQTVYMPETSAGCPMADMARAETMQQAWDDLEAVEEGWLPVVYVNSSAEVKACCGRLGGSTCTSSNASRVFEWAFKRGRRVLFLPDEHLGVNTAADLGLSSNEVVRYDPALQQGGLSGEEIAGARVVVWKGFCVVHMAFTVEQVASVRTRMPEAKIIVHPEAPRDVVCLCDAHGSTSQIIRYVEAAETGSTIVVGTELHLIERLAEEQRGRVTVLALSPSVCANMARTNEGNLHQLLRDWPSVREIHVPETVAAEARVALEQMLAL